MKVIVVYDDTGKKSEVITDIIGNKGFADVVVKRRHLEDYYRTELEKLFPGLIWYKVHSVYEYAELLKKIELYDGTDVKIIHCFSNYIIVDPEQAGLSYRKLEYIEDTYGVTDGKRAVCAMFPNSAAYHIFCKNIIAGSKAWDIARNQKEIFEIEGVVDIGVIGNFIQCVAGNFDSRYFNSIEGNEYILVKRSANKQKIHAEYNFYHLLPDDMKYWFVMPFNYEETSEVACYSMERLHMTDLAIKWVHGSMDESEFEGLLDKYFYFFRCRHVKECSDEVYRQVSDELYVDKVIERVDRLKALPEFGKISSFLTAAQGVSIDSLVEKYFSLKNKVEAKIKFPKELVIGHGDPCFANALYNKSTKTLKFIDPKGAMEEKDLWTNAYYDVAKLSHSVCGRYDFFNNALFDIKIENDFSYSLEIPFDNSRYRDIFRRKVEENGFDYWAVRIYEASLFLSMLPLHIDNPHKVLGFILNVKSILEEIEKNV